MKLSAGDLHPRVGNLILLGENFFEPRELELDEGIVGPPTKHMIIIYL